MKSFSFQPASLLGILCFSLLSCGGPTEEKDTAAAASTDTTTIAASPAPAPSTITTTPQAMLVVRHKVADFDKWLASYESHDSLRLANGIHSYVIGRGVTDPNTILVANKVDDIEKAKAFGKSADLKQAMKKSGVTGTPIVNLYTMVYQDTAVLSTTLRSRTTFTVKDWDKWQKSFDSSRQIRADNGVIDRAYGHDADNNKKVTLVVAVTDTAKANLFWKSDQLKKLRASSGALGVPDRFNYRVAKRY